MSDQEEQEPCDDPAARLAQRVAFLITSDPDLTAAEAVGTLVMLAIDLSTRAMERVAE